MAALPDPRRIVLSNLPLPAAFADKRRVEPAVQVASELVPAISELDGQAARHTVFTHLSVPTSNAGLDITSVERGLTIPGGANVRFNDLAPGGRVPMHRSQTTDYDIFLHGSVTLITPDEAYDPETGKGRVRETICKPGEVVMMRGALHAWENRSAEWVRFISVVIGAEPTTVEIEANEGAIRTLPDCFDV
ncbi:hypothetical protein N431DRAFT_434354 [Stipitochalara longipes BDJ]|nr:hypothetical protein N431DRAFT_434354 [Stipitochalara longipes BDJ]